MKRATNNGVIIYNNYLHFNPRPREEGDHRGKHRCNDFLDISIHALVKRATHKDTRDKFLLLDFNPRPREEGDAVQTRLKKCSM